DFALETLQIDIAVRALYSAARPLGGLPEMLLVSHRAASSAIIAALLQAAAAVAQGTTDQPASVLLFPGGISAPGTGNLLHITNTANHATAAHCFYVNSGGCRLSGFPCVHDADCAPGDSCAPQCSYNDFTIDLTAQQPTHWLASEGRDVDPL